MHVAVTLRCCHLIYQFGALVRAGALQLCIVEPRNGLHERLSLAAANDSSLERGRTRIGAARDTMALPPAAVGAIPVPRLQRWQLLLCYTVHALECERDCAVQILQSTTCT